MSTGGGGLLRRARGRAPEQSTAAPTERPDLALRVRLARRRRAGPSAGGNGGATSRRERRSPGASALRWIRRVPLAAWVCASVALANAISWSLITPPFQVPDEPDHFAYTQVLAATGRPPTLAGGEYSREEEVVLGDLDYAGVRLRPEGRPISSRAEQQKLRSDLDQGPSRQVSGDGGLATSEPPLYYALQTIPYTLGSSGTILDQLALMRLLSAGMAAITALFAFLFLRECLPRARWAWTVGALGVALSPLLGFVSGGVNPDSMLFAVSAALFYCLARAFRRGLTRASAIAIGAVIALGCVTKLNFVGLIPGALLGLVLLTRREARTMGPRAYRRMLLPGLVLAAAPGLLYALVNTLSNRSALGIVTRGMSGISGGPHRSLSAEMSFIWQFYLPRLPGMHSYFGALFTTRQIWFRDLVGLYGWSDVVFPGWVYGVALIPVVLITVLAGRETIRARRALRARTGELATYTAIALGLLLLIGAAGYLSLETAPSFYAAPRYMLPIVVLWGAVLALAARGAGRKWGPAVGALIVVLVLAHDIFSQLQLVARYYI